jgi:hypothetical protein
LFSCYQHPVDLKDFLKAFFRPESKGLSKKSLALFFKLQILAFLIKGLRFNFLG